MIQYIVTEALSNLTDILAFVLPEVFQKKTSLLDSDCERLLGKSVSNLNLNQIS
jgi:hypothetical protein